MKLHHLETLLALVEAGSVRGAARQLGLSQPSVTSRISDFESEVGAVLVNRTVRGTTLTHAGRAALRHARLIQGQVRRAQQELAEVARGGVKSIAIGASAIAVLEVVAAAFSELQARDPSAYVKIYDGQFHETSVRLREGELDMVIAPIPIGKKVDKTLQIEELVEYPVQVVARPGHPRARCEHLADLVSASWVSGFATSSNRSALDELFHEHGLPKPQVTATVDSLVPVQAIVATSDALGLLPVPLLQGVVGTLVPLPLKDRIRPLRLALITLAGAPLSPIAAELADLVRGRAKLAARRQAVTRRR